MLHPRYIVVNQESGWKIVHSGRRYPENYADKRQALCSAIALAEQAGSAGRRPQVLVRHEDGRFATAWVFGQTPHAEEDARQPWVLPRYKST